MMPDKEISVFKSNKLFNLKCEYCRNYLDENNLFSPENFNEIDNESLSQIIASEMDNYNNQNWFHSNISKDMEIYTKQIIGSVILLVIAILFYFIATGNLLLLLIAYIPLIYMIFRSIKLLRIEK